MGLSDPPAPIILVMSPCAWSTELDVLSRTMTPDELVEIEMIKRLKYAYARCLDLKLLGRAGEAVHRGRGRHVQRWRLHVRGPGRDPRLPAALDGRRDVPLEPQDAPSGDRPHRPERRAAAPGRSTTWWSRRSGRSRSAAAPSTRTSYVKVAGTWRIKRTGYRRVFEEIQPRGNVEGLRLTASWWATDGRSELPAG